MASELRWILLGLGLALIAGLWWWERRRPSAPPEESSVRVPDRFEPRLDGAGAGATGGHGGAIAADVAARSHDSRPVPTGDPPLVTIDDLPENTDSVVLAPEPLPEERVPPAAPTNVVRPARSVAGHPSKLRYTTTSERFSRSTRR